MVRVNILVLDKHLDAVTRALGACGRVHLADAVPQSGHNLLRPVARAAEIQRRETLLQKCRLLLEATGLPEPAADAALAPLPEEALAEALARIEIAAQAETRALDALEDEAGTLAREADHLARLPLRQVPLGQLRDLKHLHAALGRIPAAARAGLAAALGPEVLVWSQPAEHEGEVYVLVLAARRHRFAVDGALAKLGFKREDMPEHWLQTATAEAARVAARRQELARAQATHRARLQELAAREGATLRSAWLQLRQSLTALHAQEQFGQAERLFCISGWLPAQRQ